MPVGANERVFTLLFAAKGVKCYNASVLQVSRYKLGLPVVNLEKAVHEKYIKIKIYLTRDYKYVSQVQNTLKYQYCTVRKWVSLHWVAKQNSSRLKFCSAKNPV